MPTKTDAESKYTQWQDDNKHLGVQVALGELRKKWQPRNEEWQRQAMHEAQHRQRACRAVKPLVRIQRILIH